MKYRKSLGGPVIPALQGSVLKHPSKHAQQPSLTLASKHRPQTSGAGSAKIKKNSHDQRQLLQMSAAKDRSRQKNSGLNAAMPSYQQ